MEAAENGSIRNNSVRRSVRKTGGGMKKSFTK
jgi:hypothetical protein